MKTASGIAFTVALLVALAPMCSWAQTSIGEVNTTLRMNEELDNIGGGPSASRLNPSAVAPGPGPSRAPAPAPGPSVMRPPAPAVPGGPASTGGSAAPPAVGGPSRVVKAPENGFVPTRAAQAANIGFEYMHDMRFDEAVDAYRRAMEADNRYAPAYQGMLQAVNQIKQYGPDMVGQIVMTEQPVKVTIAEYFGWR